MKNKENEKYFKLGITGFLVLAAGIVFFFLVYRFDIVRGWGKSINKMLRPVINGAVIAYLLAPLCSRLEKLGERWFGRKAGTWSRVLAVIISLLAAVALVWLLVALLLPQLWTSIDNIVKTYPQKEEVLEAWLRHFMENRPGLLSSMEGFFEQISDKLQQWMENKLLPTVQSWAIGLGTHVYGLLGAVKDLLIGLLISAYVLYGRKRFAAQGRLLLHSLCSPLWARRIEKEIRFADKMFNGFLMGKLADSAIIGVLCMIGVSIIGIGPAVLVSTIVGITNIIPFFGPFIGAIPCALLILLESPLKCLYFIIFILALQQLDGNVIGPLILGDSTGLPSFWVLFAILLFGGLWGVPGMIVGVPLFAVIYDVSRQALYAALQKRGETTLISAYDREFHKPAPEKKRRRWKPLYKTKKK